jgi:hypothetical protein
MKMEKKQKEQKEKKQEEKKVEDVPEKKKGNVFGDPVVEISNW